MSDIACAYVVRAYCSVFLLKGSPVRVVEFDGKAVKRQRQSDDGKIKVCFYDSRLPDLVVTPEMWKARARNKYYSGDVRRRYVVRKATK